MAWISVHEQVIGGKLRNLSKEIGCSQNEALGILIRLWLWGINNADKEGFIIGAAKEDVAEVLTTGIDKRYPPESAVEALINTGWIDVEDGNLFIHDWKEWQMQWYKAMEMRQRDAARKREQRGRAKADRDSTEGPFPAPRLVSTEKETFQMPHSPTIASYSKDFEEFWEVYPRKVGKGEAYKKYKARRVDGWKPEELRIAAEKYAEVCRRMNTEKEYIKHPKTFLSDNTPFTDYLPKPDRIDSTVENEDNPYSEWR